MQLSKLQAPFPWFGGKRRVACEIWKRFGDVSNYVEPFFGSGAVLLGRPNITGTETINDLDGFVANFWRSIKLSPSETAKYADNPVNENDLHARHIWLVHQIDTLRPSLEGNPDWHDPKIAGYWVWGQSTWIGGEWCSGKGPWNTDESGKLVKLNDGKGIKRQLVYLGNSGQGVNRKLIHLGCSGKGVNAISRKDSLVELFESLAKRLERVRVCSGDWSRACGPSVTFKQGTTAVFLDPPYADTAHRDTNLYRVDSTTVAYNVRKWAVENGTNPLMKIALCGYDGEHEMPSDWSVYKWDAGTGMSMGKNDNGKKERIWFSPACIDKKQMTLFE